MQKPKRVAKERKLTPSRALVALAEHRIGAETGVGKPGKITECDVQAETAFNAGWGTEWDECIPCGTAYGACQ
jgi:hypothetical protein